MEVHNVKAQQTHSERLISTRVIRGYVAAVHKLGMCCMDRSTATWLPQGNGETALTPSLPPQRSVFLRVQHLL